MRATTLSAAAFALPAVAGSRQDSSQAVVLLQQRAGLEQQVSWDVKAWFDKLRHKESAEKTADKATDNTKADKTNADDKAKNWRANSSINAEVDESLASNETSGECADWCAEDSYVKLEAGVEVTKDISSWTAKCTWVHCNGCAKCGDSLVETAANTEEEKQEVSLSQATAELQSGYGNTVPVTEAGYQTIAALQDNEQMKQFIHRVAASEARFVKDAGALNGLVPFYSGVQSVQNLDALRNELRKAPWVLDTEGRRAPLSDFGYHKVATMMSKPDMVAFARRVLDMVHKTVTDESAFIEHVSHYNGETGRSFEDLQHSLVKATWTRSREVPKEEAVAPAPEAAAAPQPVELKEAKRGKGAHAKKEEPAAPAAPEAAEDVAEDADEAEDVKAGKGRSGKGDRR